MTKATWLGDRVRVPSIFGDEVLTVLMVDTAYGRVLIEVPIEDGSGRVVEYIEKWVDLDVIESL
jgi:hypothetical protein